ncbi:sensor histidine kinase [Eudoraea chungangensis]|uniref:sensor histidine kinase n=1 Tax=Eudoraea chungangensis TaxID=1481905 RepID=UPI0023EC810C|nr:histidine kinase [Eudoraea chungangensis]
MLRQVKVKQARLIKVSLILAVLVTLPKTIYIYNKFHEGDMDFSIDWVADFFIKFVFFFLFSYLILQLNSNWGYFFTKYKKVIRVVAVIILNLGILLAGATVLDFIFDFIIGNPLSVQEKGFLFFELTVLVIILLFVSRILRLQLVTQVSLVENERLKQQNLQTELAALKNQIDPHFLFNSLNSLSCLIKDNDSASQFVKKLSFMYRYILQSGDRDLVSLKEELKFLDSYCYLMKTRYRDRFRLVIDIDEKYLSKQIPPLALQLLVENAVKHNEISESNPLTVNVFSQDGSIYVENKLQPRTVMSEGTGNGLVNLDKRYYLIEKQRITISKDDNKFSVKLPLK